MKPRRINRFQVAAALRELATRLSARGAGRYRVRAYERAARTVEQTSGDLSAMAAGERLTDLPGIGDKLSAVIAELARVGTTPQLETLRREGPAVKVAHGDAPLILGEALDAEARILAYLREGRGIARAEPAGELRRRLEVVSRLDFVIAARRPAAALGRFCRFPGASEVVARTATTAAIRLEGIVAHAVAMTSGRFPLAWLEQTGAPEHVEALKARARIRGVPLAGRSEEALYRRLALAPVPPELRDDPDALAEAARDPEAFADLVTAADIRGYVHCHTRYSDGSATVEAMAAAAKARGRSYITITDHSPTAHYAGGLTLDRLKRQWDEIAVAEEKVGIRILRGTEADILKDGGLDYPDRVLEQLDVVIASLHQRYQLDAKATTRRLVAAMRHPCFKIWGHGLGRLLLRRPPVECDVEAVLDALADSRGAIEVNGNPHRLDLDPRWLRAARERGIRFVLSTDAHATGELENLETAVMMARRAGLRRGEVLNARTADEFAEVVRPAA